MAADIEAFLHAPTSTWSYVVSDPSTARAAVIDAVLDYEPKSGRTATESVDAIIDYVRRREARDATLEMPTLIIPSVQVNIRAGRLPAPQANGIAYLKIPLNTFGRPGEEPS